MLRPTHNYVLIDVDETDKESKTENGLIVVDNSDNRPTYRCKVLGVGPLADHKEAGFEVGDTVLVGRNAIDFLRESPSCSLGMCQFGDVIAVADE
jgi:co-chaperonin GroES (HSP10)